MLRYLDDLDDLDAAHDNDIITVVLSDFVLDKWWEQLLHNQSAKRGVANKAHRSTQPLVCVFLRASDPIVSAAVRLTRVLDRVR